MIEVPGTKEYEGPHEFVALTMRALEQSTHRKGWQKDPMTLYRLFPVDISSTTDPDDGTKEVTAHYSVSAYPLPHADPIRELRRLATLIESPLAPLALALYASEYDSPPEAHVLTSEAWFHADDEEYAQARESGQDMLDMPGTKFTRILIGVAGDNYLLYRRIRGEQPLWFPADAAQDKDGPFDLLSRIHRAEVGTWRRVFGDSVDTAAWRKLFRGTP